MISKNRLKYLSSLNKKKFRRIEKKIIVEGVRAVFEGLKSSYICEEVFISESHSENVETIVATAKQKDIPIQNVSVKELGKFTETKTPQSVAALFHIKDEIQFIKNAPVIALDNISDPGNLGTIIRTCDWFGIKNILLGEKSVELFNPKVIRSTMGSIFHIHYEIADNLIEKLDLLKKDGFDIVVADIKGTDINKAGKFNTETVLVLGSEAFGPSEKIIDMADYKVKIPGIGNAESLNVAVAGGILIYEMFAKKKVH